MVAKNLKFLRELFDEKQLVVAKSLGVSQNTISDYETQTKKIPMERILKISKRYSVSVDDLMNKDLSQIYDVQKIVSIKDICGLAYYPQISDIKSTNDEYNRLFESTYTEVNCLWDEVLTEMFRPDFEKLDIIIKLYFDFYKQTQIYAPLVNIVSILLTIYTLNNPAVEKLSVELQDRDDDYEFELKGLLFHDIKTVKQQSTQSATQKEIFDRYNNIVYENLKILKMSKNNMYCCLGDYYLALGTYLGFVDDVLEYQDYRLVGFGMLLQLVRLDNLYAERFVDSVCELLF